MNSVLRISLSVGLFSANILAALLSVPTTSLAQTYNTATGTQALYHLTTGYDNTADGYQALFYNTTGNYNIGIGSFALYSNSSGGLNTAIGDSALYSNTTGNYNTATGSGSLSRNTTGVYNTGNGLWTLNYNTTGSYNTANGATAMNDNTTGGLNTANGYQALNQNTTGSYNTANGVNALYTNDSGNYNVANGFQALQSNTTGNANTANGNAALFYTTTGNGNTADGNISLHYNTTGQYNTANGDAALYFNTTGNYNTADGFVALYNATGSNNIALGNSAGLNVTTGSNNIEIGHQGAAGDNGIIRIGTIGTQTETFIAGINGVTASKGVPVYITANGKLCTVTSSQRFKYDIRDLGATSDKLMDLRPVSFRYKEAAEDGTHPVQYGLIAEEVARVYPDLVQYDKQGKPFTVYYHLLTPMMLNELQKAHQQLAAQQTEINSLKATVQHQSAGTTSLQHMVQSLLMVVGAVVLITLVGSAYFFSSRILRVPFLRVRPSESRSGSATVLRRRSIATRTLSLLVSGRRSRTPV